MYIYTEKEMKKVVEIDEKAISVVEDGFTSLATRHVEMPPIMRVDVHQHNGEVDVKTAYIEGYDMFAIKVSSGFFNNDRLGLPSGNGMMMLLSSVTGIPQAFLLDNGYLTHVRTAAAGAVAAKYLAKEHVEAVGVIGTGSQARYQLQALQKVRNYKKVYVYGRSQQKVDVFVEEMQATLGISVEGTESAEAVVKHSEVVITTTPSKEPVLKAEWLHPGLHITAMGSDAEHKQELEAAILQRADLLVCDVKSQCFRLGELHHGLEQGMITADSPIFELGEITSGKASGRTSNDQITVCDLTGTGVQDTVIALYAHQVLKENKFGLKIKND